MPLLPKADGLEPALAIWDKAVAESRRLQRAAELVTGRLPERTTAAEAAKAARLERNSFSRHFRLRVGVTFSTWYRALRVARAIGLLRDRSRTTEGVARAAGFGTVRSMERAFKKLLGSSPRELRERAGGHRPT